MKLNTRFNFLFLLIPIVGSILDGRDDSQIPDYPRNFTITQRLDHFNKSDTRLWEQKYFISGEHYNDDGPVFVLVGDDTAASLDLFTSRYQFMKYAKRYNALCLYLEPRFFGDSQPTKDLSLDILKHFTLDQALEDLVEFRAVIEYRYKLTSNNKKWIFFGSVNGEILSAIFKIFDKISLNCTSAIDSAVKQIEAYIEDGPIGWAKLKDKFKICAVLDGSDKKEIEDFYYRYAFVIHNFVIPTPDENDTMTAETLCGIMNERGKGPEIDRFVQMTKLFSKPENSDCANTKYETNFQRMKDTSLDSPMSEFRLDWYRECTEQPYFYASEDPKVPFYSTYSLSFLTEGCAEVFGPQFDINFINSGINATNKEFGYEAINDQLTNILFVGGAEDPELSLQISKDVNSEVKAFVIQGEAGCTDTFPSRISDLKELIKARLNIAREIGNWING